MNIYIIRSNAENDPYKYAMTFIGQPHTEATMDEIWSFRQMLEQSYINRRLKFIKPCHMEMSQKEWYDSYNRTIELLNSLGSIRYWPGVMIK